MPRKFSERLIWLLMLILAGFLAAPILALGVPIIKNTSISTWIYRILLPRYAANTLIVMIGVGLISTLIAVSCAWFTSFYRFRGRNITHILLLMPMALPGYVIAFTYVYEFGSWGIFNIRSKFGYILIMSLSLYPYIYILLHNAFGSLAEEVNVARTFTTSQLKILLLVVLPIARPALFSGLALLLMETLADLAVAQFLAVDTLTTGVYRAWFLLRDYKVATLIALVILAFSTSFILLERSTRGNERRYCPSPYGSLECFWLARSWARRALIYIICWIPIVLGFILPIAILIYWTIQRYATIKYNFIYVINSVVVAGVAASAIAAISLIFAYFIRNKSKFTTLMIRIAALGYAFPSIIITMGLLVFLGGMTRFLEHFNYKLAIIGSIPALIYAYSVRFLSVSLNSLESALSKIPREIDWSAYSLGYSKVSTYFRVNVPLLERAITVAFLMTFVDTFKDLTITLLIRPFNFETAAIRVYNLVMDERYQEAAFPSLVLSLISVLVILLLTRFDRPKA